MLIKVILMCLGWFILGILVGAVGMYSLYWKEIEGWKWLR